MPGELLTNLKTLYENETITSSADMVYGMDNTVTLWVNDGGDGKIDSASGDHVYAYASMRRGGRSLYALDITHPKQPRLLWNISGGKTPGFDKLGQTWSQPVKSRIMHNGQDRDVLIFAGGYHPDEDIPVNYRKSVAYGNDVYIVDAKTGQLIWSASQMNLPDMKYSIPGKVRVTHSGPLTVKTGKPYANQLVFADTGGQIWRLMLNNGETGTPFNVTVDGVDGVIARTAGAGTVNQRRFYHTPDVVLHAREKQLIVNIGSGYHARPLTKDVQDRFYSIRVPLSGTGQSISLDDGVTLVDVTNRLKLGDGDTISEIKTGKKGWYFNMDASGEKTISNATTARKIVFFNTFVPGIQTKPCDAVAGQSYTYAVNLLDGLPAVKELSGVSAADTARKMLNNALFPAGATNTMHFGDGEETLGPGGPGDRPKRLPKRKDKAQKTYWMDMQD